MIFQRSFCFPTSKDQHFAFSPATNQNSCCLTFSSALSVVHVPDLGHPNRCAVVSQCFHLHFLDDIWWEVSFHVLICHLFTFFGEVSPMVFGQFFSGLFSYCWVLNVLCIFWIQQLFMKCLLYSSEWDTTGNWQNPPNSYSQRVYIPLVEIVK